MAVFVLMLRHVLAGEHLDKVFELGIASAFGAAVYIGMIFLLGIPFRTISMRIA
jgi:hypothetical protein